jgi:hypothetical protein
MTSVQRSIRPDLSQDLGLIGKASIEEIVSGGFTLVAVVGKSTGLTGVISGNVIAVGPAVVGVVVATAAAVLCAVAGAVAGAIGGAVGAAAGTAKRSNFDVLGGDLFCEFCVACREICKHLSIRGCSGGEVRKSIRCFGDEGVHGVVGTMVSSFLGGSLGKTEIKMCFGEVGLEVGPGFVRHRLATPFTARLRK